MGCPDEAPARPIARAPAGPLPGVLAVASDDALENVDSRLSELGSRRILGLNQALVQTRLDHLGQLCRRFRAAKRRHELLSTATRRTRLGPGSGPGTLGMSGHSQANALPWPSRRKSDMSAESSALEPRLTSSTPAPLARDAPLADVQEHRPVLGCQFRHEVTVGVNIDHMAGVARAGADGGDAVRTHAEGYE